MHIKRKIKQVNLQERKENPELSNNIWNEQCDAQLPDKHRMEQSNKTCLEYINSTFGGMCINKMQERQNKFNNHFKSI